MKKSTLTYLVYLLSILGITAFLSVQILKGEISLPEGVEPIEQIRKKVGLAIEERGLLETLKVAHHMEKMADHHANSLGFHDVEWQIEKPSNVWRIIALGDSMTHGSAVSLNSTWPKQLERMLNDLKLPVKFEVFNAGMGGWGTFEEVETFKNLAMSYDPDMIILQYYPGDWHSPKVNDEAREVWKKYKRGEWKLPPEIEKETRRLNVSHSIISSLILQIVRENYLANVDWEEEWDRWVKEPLVEMVGIVRNRKIKFMAITWDTTAVEKDKLFHLLSDHQVPIYDLSEHLPIVRKIVTLPMGPTWICVSPTRLPDCHPSALGHEVVANKTVDALVREFDLWGLK